VRGCHIRSIRWVYICARAMSGRDPMTDDRLLAERFEQHRRHLRAVAYRMLGSLSEADDAVQEAWLRVSRAESGDVENLRGWPTTIVARVCLNTLRSRNSRPEEPLGPHVPDPIVGVEDGFDPEHEVLLAEPVGLALLVVLDALAPAERLAFVLHDMFAVPFDEIAPIVERSPAATRQLASRARRRVQRATPFPDADLRGRRRGARRRVAAGARRPGGRHAVADLRQIRRRRADAGPRQRRRRSRDRVARTTSLGRGLHDPARPDRGDRRPRRPRPPSTT
jgi:RNA polymerase sigma factor (sigma-70 family)